MEKNIARIVVLLFISLAIFGLINSLYLSKREKIYTIGKIYDRTEPGRKTTYYFSYSIGGKDFKGRTFDLNRYTTNKNGFLYLEILAENHNEYHVLEFNIVPDCLTLKDVPANGWSKLPTDTICK